MPLDLSEGFISQRLKEKYKPGVVASTDGYAEMYTGKHLKCAAVLIPLIYWKKEWHLVFTRRTEAVEHHKGQVSFPGGGCDEGETTPEQTALREASEEIGLNARDVHLLGRLNEVLTITQFRITPVVGVIPWPYEMQLEPVEVKRVFTIPLFWCAKSSHWVEQAVALDKFPRKFPVVKYQQYDGEILWGASARIVHNFLKVLGLLETH